MPTAYVARWVPIRDRPCVVPGHQIAEMALAKLYLFTGDKKYLDEAKFFLDYRGKTANKKRIQSEPRTRDGTERAVGHAVRRIYVAGMADVAAHRRYCLYPCHRQYLGQHRGVRNSISRAASVRQATARRSVMIMNCRICRHTARRAPPSATYVNYRLFLLHGESKL